jgi:flagellar basal-body rod protein FlgB
MDVNRTNEGHIAGKSSGGADLFFRNPYQPSIDGNTVDSNVENAEFTKNAMSYNASFDFLNRKFKGLTSAIKGQ